MKKAILVAAGILIGTSGAFAVSEIFKATGSAEYRVEAGGQYGNKITTTETRFFEQALYGANARLFKVVERSEFHLGLDGYQAKSVIEAYQTKTTMFDSKAWTLKTKGGDFEVFNDYLIQVSEAGCCDSPEIYHIIDASTGKETIAALNESTIELEIPNSKLESRYIAHVQDTKAPRKLGSKTYIGTIGYFTASKVKSIARIYAQIPDYYGTGFFDLKPLLRAKDEAQKNKFVLWAADGSSDASTAFSGVGLSATISYENKKEQFAVVIDNDQLSSSKSKVSSDLAISVVNY